MDTPVHSQKLPTELQSLPVITGWDKKVQYVISMYGRTAVVPVASVHKLAQFILLRRAIIGTLRKNRTGGKAKIY